MKTTKISILSFCLMTIALLVGCASAPRQDNSTQVWGDGYIGSRGDLRYFPDVYANYWIYAFDTVENQGLCINGNFPDARFFNFVLYDESTTAQITSLEDVNFVPNNGSVNPFKQTVKQPTKNTYTLYFMPDNTPNEVRSKLPNALYYPAGVKRLSVILRYYVPIDDFGAAPLPRVSSVDTKTLASSAAPVRVRPHLDTLPEFPEATFSYQPIAVFLRAIRSYGYVNIPADYLYTASALKDGELLVFRFKSPKAPTKVEEYPSADVRYWSVSAATSKSFVVSSIVDKDFKVGKDGWVTVVFADSGSSRYSEIVKKAAASTEINVLPWPKAKVGPGFLILYRNLVINPAYTHGMSNVDMYVPDHTTVKRPTPKEISHLVIGDWGPAGKMYTEEAFLDSAFSIDTIRILR